MAWISSGVARRSSSPITFWRMLPCPAKAPKFTPNLMSLKLFRNGASGIGELPLLPSISVVTPCRM